MDHDAFYTVACLVRACGWETCRPSFHHASIAGRQHERSHEGHVTFVFLPDEAVPDAA